MIQFEDVRYVRKSLQKVFHLKKQQLEYTNVAWMIQKSQIIEEPF